MPSYSSASASASPSPGPPPPPEHHHNNHIPPLHTYHHICSTLLLATPYPLATLPRRAPPSLDKAYILPLPLLNGQSSFSSAKASSAPPKNNDAVRSSHDDGNGTANANPTANANYEGGEGHEVLGRHISHTDADGHDDDDNEDEDDDADEADEVDVDQKRNRQKPTIWSSLLAPNLRPGRKLLVVRREDGYEVRRVWRCGRCGGVVGYEVVSASSSVDADGGGGGGGGASVSVGLNGGRASKAEEDKEEGKVLFLIEGALVETSRLGEIGDGDEGDEG